MVKESISISNVQQSRFLKDLKDLILALTNLGDEVNTTVQTSTGSLQVTLNQIAVSLAQIAVSLEEIKECICDPNFGD